MLKRFLLCLLCVASAAAAQPRRIVMLIGEDEYHTWETLPAFAQSELRPHGYEVTIVQEDPKLKNHFPGLVSALPGADLLVLSTRRRTPVKAQLQAVRKFLQNGGGLVGIRTACHAFALMPKTQLTDPALDHWEKFDPEVLGGNYRTHYHFDAKTVVSVAPGAAGSPLLDGVAVDQLVGNGQLYEVKPLVADATPLLEGTISGHPSEPLAWTHRYGPHRSRIFYTSLGAPADFQEPAFRRLLLNAIDWAAAK